mmetsp:Transcript_17081/g.50427  ORF Transcript_17081/g.50427 Transcript_17081/m.50427 type:complete len:81 (+) Transcript_17081:121-363(+)
MVQVLQGIELVQGYPLPTLEQEDFLHFWAVIGWAMGIEDRFNPCARDTEHAYTTLEAILMVAVHSVLRTVQDVIPCSSRC